MTRRPALLVGFLALVAIVATHGSNASATLVAVDLFTAGDGLLTRDTGSGLDWIDVTATVSRSYNDIEAGAGGWISLGFRHATGSELCGLFATYAEAPAPCPASSSHPGAVVDPDLVQALQGFVGVTFSGRGIEASSGYFDDGNASDNVGVASLQYNSSSSSGRSSVRSDVALATQTSGSTSGHWLVRPVPEPSTAVLVAAGLIVLALRGQPGRST